MYCGLIDNDNPCKNCKEGRSATCHSTCKLYLQWQKEWNAKREKKNLQEKIEREAACTDWPRRIRRRRK